MSMRGNRRRPDPALLERRRRRRLMLVRTLAYGTAAIGGIAWGMNALNARLSVQHWRIDAPESLRPAIERALAELPSRDFWHTRAGLLAERLRAEVPEIGGLEITRRLPDTVHIRARARRPVALWLDGEGRLWLVDRKARAYRSIARLTDAPDLPVLRAPRAQLPEALALMEELRNTPRPAGELSEVRRDASGWRLNFAGGGRWWLPARDAANTVRRIQALLNEPRWKGRAWRIDARASGRWFLRPVSTQGVI